MHRPYRTRRNKKEGKVSIMYCTYIIGFCFVVAAAFTILSEKNMNNNYGIYKKGRRVAIKEFEQKFVLQNFVFRRNYVKFILKTFSMQCIVISISVLHIDKLVTTNLFTR